MTMRTIEVPPVETKPDAVIEPPRGVVDGWASLSDTVTHKLERWRAESERSLSSHDLPSRNVGP